MEADGGVGGARSVFSVQSCTPLTANSLHLFTDEERMTFFVTPIASVISCERRMFQAGGESRNDRRVLKFVTGIDSGGFMETNFGLEARICKRLVARDGGMERVFRVDSAKTSEECDFLAHILDSVAVRSEAFELLSKCIYSGEDRGVVFVGTASEVREV